MLDLGQTMAKGLALLAWSCALYAGEDLSPAEVLLFQTNHMKSVGDASRLTYRFHKRGALEREFDDQVEIIVSARDGKKSVSTNYLNGANKTEFPPVENAEGNPVVMYFLERDIREMQRLTGGHWVFFQKRIRMALAESAIVRPVSFVYEGTEAKGQEVKITPFASDPLRPRFERFADKFYVFMLSDAVPGGVYQVRAVVPPDKAAGTEKPAALVEETLTLSKAAR